MSLADYRGKLVRIRYRTGNTAEEDTVGELVDWSGHWIELNVGEPRFIPYDAVLWLEPELT